VEGKAPSRLGHRERQMSNLSDDGGHRPARSLSDNDPGPVKVQGSEAGNSQSSLPNRECRQAGDSVKFAFIRTAWAAFASTTILSAIVWSGIRPTAATEARHAVADLVWHQRVDSVIALALGVVLIISATIHLWHDVKHWLKSIRAFGSIIAAAHINAIDRNAMALGKLHGL
jgi:hypothetical protein